MSIDTNEIIDLVSKYVGNGFAYKLVDDTPDFPYPEGLEEYHPTIDADHASTGHFHVETLLGIDVDARGIFYYIRMNLSRNTQTSWNARVRPIIESLKFRRVSDNELKADYFGNSVITKTITDAHGSQVERKYKLVNITAYLGATAQGKLDIKEKLLWLDTITDDNYQSVWGWRDYKDGR